MFYVVDEWSQEIKGFKTQEEAEKFCEEWNRTFFSDCWTGPKATVIEVE